MPKLAELRTLDDREQKLDELFMRWNDVAPMLSGSKAFGRPDFGSGEEGCALMPLAWNLSYRKLEILMRYMAVVADQGSQEFKGRHAALCEWYGRGRWRRTKVKRTDRFTRKKYEAEEMVFHGGNADPVRVHGALSWLSGHFPGEIYLPKEFLDVAA